MKRIALGVALLLGALLTESPAAFADTCIDRLDTNAYSCTVKLSSGGELPDTLTFTTAPAFTLTSGAVPGFTLTCACGTTGTFKKPNFFADQKQWTCLVGSGGGAVEINGNVKGGGTNITRVEGTDATGTTVVWSCPAP